MFTTLAKAKKILLFPLIKKKRVGMIYNEDPLTALLNHRKIN